MKLYRSFCAATSFIAVCLHFPENCISAAWDSSCQCNGVVLTLAQRHKLLFGIGEFMVFNFEQVHNYYERLVFEEVARRSADHPNFTTDMLGDVACVALNRLPARYVRHDVDMMFYLTEQERSAIEQSLDEVLKFAFGFVLNRATKSVI
jgi:hypothetical protein